MRKTIILCLAFLFLLTACQNPATVKIIDVDIIENVANMKFSIKANEDLISARAKISGYRYGNCKLIWNVGFSYGDLETLPKGLTIFLEVPLNLSELDDVMSFRVTTYSQIDNIEKFAAESPCKVIER